MRKSYPVVVMVRALEATSLLVLGTHLSVARIRQCSFLVVLLDHRPGTEQPAGMLFPFIFVRWRPTVFCSY
jgi:hypothetical protein